MFMMWIIRHTLFVFKSQTLKLHFYLNLAYEFIQQNLSGLRI
uniref:Macaca fascicularis brain cDNA clone: QbsA-11382, similar to human serologically defined colon cancer antigen 1 (SDCCAG1), mRNA, RefSeq: NM_004713.2 n=1 Tax=Macaca fascicularis TaxID=9541 RepID=I7GHP8_MACFA|nr:unnamed protein product [Macaca fascicularis]